jgi:LacI family transcriptional regulator
MINATNRQGAYEATKYLIDLGHQRIGFVTGLPGLSSAAERLEGYRMALKDHGIELSRELIAEGNFLQQGGYLAGQKLLDLAIPPTAIFAANDLSAFGVMEVIRERGLQIPNDISIIGFDDIPQASITYPKLSTVRQPLEQMGNAAVLMLLEHLEDPSREMGQVTLTTELIIRDSCQSPRQ